MKENYNYQRYNRGNFHIHPSVTIFQMITRKISSKPDTRYSKGENEEWLNKIL
jgi:hypothetical protein